MPGGTEKPFSRKEYDTKNHPATGNHGHSHGHSHSSVGEVSKLMGGLS
jgi:hypothetical protein